MPQINLRRLMWVPDRDTRREASAFNETQVKRMFFFAVPYFFDEGMPEGFDVPRLLFRDRPTIQFVLELLRTAWKLHGHPLTMERPQQVVFVLKNGQSHTFHFNLREPWLAFGQRFFQEVPRLLAQKSLEQVRQQLQAVQGQIQRIETSSKRVYKQPSEIGQIVRRLERVDERYFVITSPDTPPYLGVLTLVTPKKRVRLGFLVRDRRLLQQLGI